MLLNSVPSSALPQQMNACHGSPKKGQHKQDLDFCLHFNSCKSIWCGKKSERRGFLMIRIRSYLGKEIEPNNYVLSHVCKFMENVSAVNYKPNSQSNLQQQDLSKSSEALWIANSLQLHCLLIQLHRLMWSIPLMCISFTALYVCHEHGLWLKRELYCHRMRVKKHNWETSHEHPLLWPNSHANSLPSHLCVKGTLEAVSHKINLILTLECCYNILSL